MRCKKKNLIYECVRLFSMKNKSKCSFIFLSILFFIFGISAEVLAHRVNVFAAPEGDKIIVDCYYSNGEKVHKGKIKIIEEKTDRIVFEGVTDDKGELTSRIPEVIINGKSSLHIVLDAGMGHRATWDVPYEELASSLSEPRKTPESIKGKVVEKKAEVQEKNRIKPVSVIVGLVAIFVLFGVFYRLKLNPTKLG